MIVVSTTSRTMLAGLTAGLLAGAGLAVPAATSAQAATSTTLTAAQAKAAFNRMSERTTVRALAGGLRLTARSLAKAEGKDDTDQLMWASTVLVDPRRRTVRETDNYASFAYAADLDVAVGGPPEDTCPAEYAWDGSFGETQTYLAKAGVARWYGIRKGSYPHTDKLKILKRTKAKWERSNAPRSTVRGALRGGFTLSTMRQDVLQNNRILGGTSTPTTSGTTYVIDYKDSQPAEEGVVDGRVTANVATDGSIVTLRQVEVMHASFKGDVDSTFVTTYRFAYDAQRVTTPKTSTVVSHKQMVRACHALRTREQVANVVYAAEMLVNERAREDGTRVTIAGIRQAARQALPAKALKLNIKGHDITHGISIVGRHKLLKHPVVWTVFLRHGKAVVHHVR